MKKRKYSEPAQVDVAQELEEICDLIERGRVVGKDLDRLRDIAFENGMYAIRNVPPADLCRLLRQRLNVPRPAMEVQSAQTRQREYLPEFPEQTRSEEREYLPEFPGFTMLPRDVQGVVWQQYLSGRAPEAVLSRLGRIGTLSKGQRQVLRSVAPSVLRNAPPLPTGPQVGPKDYSGWMGCTDFGFDEQNCRLLYDGVYDLYVHFPVDTIEDQLQRAIQGAINNVQVYGETNPQLLAWGTVAMSESDVLEHLDDTAWPCACVVIQFPLFVKDPQVMFASNTVPSDLYVRKAFFSRKGYFTVLDLLKIVVTFMQENITPQEIQQTERILIEQLQAQGDDTPVGRIFDQFFDRYDRGALWHKIKLGNVNRNLSNVPFLKFEQRVDSRGEPYLDTVWKQRYY